MRNCITRALVDRITELCFIFVVSAMPRAYQDTRGVIFQSFAGQLYLVLGKMEFLQELKSLQVQVPEKDSVYGAIGWREACVRQR